MKKLFFLLIPVLSMMFVACGGGEQTTYEIDTGALENAFATASGTVKDEVDAAAAAFRAEDIVGGADHLVRAIKAGGLSEEQINAIADTVVMVQKWMTNDTSHQTDEYYAALNEVMAALPN